MDAEPETLSDARHRLLRSLIRDPAYWARRVLAITPGSWTNLPFGACSQQERGGRDVLNRTASEAEKRSRRQHMAVAGPHFAFTYFLGCREMDSIRSAQEKAFRGSQHGGAGPPEQGFADRRQLPQSKRRVL